MKKCNKVKEAAIIPKYHSRDINMENIDSDENKSKVDSMKLAEFETPTIEKVLELLKNDPKMYYKPNSIASNHPCLLN